MNRRALAKIRLSRNAAARLAAVLLLVTCTLQVVEMSHQHGALDTAEHCLLCKVDGQVAIAADTSTAAAFYRAAHVFTANAGSVARSALNLPPARGPPARA